MLLDRKISGKGKSTGFGKVSLVLDFIQTSYEDYAIIVFKTTIPITQEEQQNMNDNQCVTIILILAAH